MSEVSDQPSNQASRHDAWQAGESYEFYMGRWSRRIAPLFLDLVALPRELDWLEVGCGTGALSAAIQHFDETRDLLLAAGLGLHVVGAEGEREAVLRG